jgi:hypothetical protein
MKLNIHRSLVAAGLVIGLSVFSDLQLGQEVMPSRGLPAA